MPTTIRQLEDALDIEIFSLESDDDFLKQCSRREKYLKSFLNVCWNEIMLHSETPLLSSHEIVGWRKAKIEQNLKNFLLYLDELVEDLNREKIEQYIRENKIVETKRLPFNADALLPILKLTKRSIIRLQVTIITEN